MIGRRRERTALATLGLVTSAVALVLLGSLVDLRGTFETFRGVDPVPLLLTLAVVGAQLVLRTLRWRSLLPRVAGGSRPAVWRLLPVLTVGYLGNAVAPARLGEPIRAYLAARREGLDLAGTLGTVALERVIDLATLAGVALAAAVLAGAPPWITGSIAAVGGLGLLVTAALVSGLFPVLVERLGSMSPTGPGPRQAIVDAVVRFGRGAGSQPRGVIFTAISVSFAAWFLDGVTFWLVGTALGLDLTYAGALLVAGVTVLGTAIPSAPGYVGTFELAAVSAATALGMPAPDALAMAVVAHLATTVPPSAAGAVSLASMSVSLRRLTEEAT